MLKMLKMFIMKFILYLWLCFAYTNCQSVRTPTITHISDDQDVEVGSSVELQCSAQFARDFSVVWVKKGDKEKGRMDLLISTNSALIIRDSRYSLRHDRGSSTYILQIKDLQDYDEGIYMCQVIVDIIVRVSDQVSLRIRKPPVIYDNFTRTVVVTRGTPVKLECYAHGVPEPKVEWRRENNALLPTGGSIYSGNQLLIPNINKEDRGTYYCIAVNGVGKGARRNINVEVEFEPLVVAVKPLVKQAQTYDAILECRVESYPPADINWIFRYESIVSNNQYRVSQFSTDDEFTDSVLTAMKLERRQFGNYTCRANNRLGWASANVFLEESYYPVCPPACELPNYSYASSAAKHSIEAFLSVLLLLRFVV